MKPPVAQKKEHYNKYHGKGFEDPYHWMREKQSPEVLKHLKMENDYTDFVMSDTKQLQKTLYDEMLARIKEDDESVPIKDGDYYYYSRTEKGKSYAIYCRKHLTLEAKEEIVLDENELAKNLEFFQLGDFELSDDHRLLAYSCDEDGSEQYTIFIKDLETGDLLKDKIKLTTGNVE